MIQELYKDDRQSIYIFWTIVRLIRTHVLNRGSDNLSILDGITDQLFITRTLMLCKVIIVK
jgi:hypothetical protein